MHFIHVYPHVKQTVLKCSCRLQVHAAGLPSQIVKKALEEFKCDRRNAASTLSRSRKLSINDNMYVLKRFDSEEYLLEDRVIHAYEVHYF